MLVSVVGLGLIAPYSFLDGIFVMNLAGKRGNASAGTLAPVPLPAVVVRAPNANWARSRRLLPSVATASIVNAAGYVGAVISPFVITLLVDDTNNEDPTEWSAVFLMLGGLTVFATAASGLYWYLDVRDQDRPPALEPAEREALLAK